MNPNTPTPFINPTTFAPAKFADFPSLLNIIIPLLTIGGALLFLAMFLFAGLTWLTSGGNSETLAKARKTMAFALLGLFLVISSYLIVKLISFILKFNLPI